MHHVRKQIRLRNYDYTSEGKYFITICVKNRECFLGEITDNAIILNEIGNIANEYLNNIPDHFSHVKMGEFIVMPNHVHCILILNEPNDDDDDVGTRHGVSLHGVSLHDETQRQNKFGQPIPGSVSVIINQFKSSVKRWCNKNAHEYFQWQSRFHDHIIRNDKEYNKIQNYIIKNPINWEKDKFYNHAGNVITH